MLLERVLGSRREPAAGVERQAFEPGSSLNLLEAFFGAKTDSGVTVTVKGALALPAVYAAVRILADSVGTTPLPVYRASEQGKSRQKAKGTSQWTLCHDRPNREMTAPMFWSTLMAHCAGYGESFIGKDFTPRPGFTPNQVTNLWPVHPELVRVGRSSAGQKLYWVRDSNGIERKRPYTDAEIVHVVGLTFDGLRGISPIEAARRAIGAGLAMTAFTDAFYGNAALPSGILSTEKELTDPAFERVSRRWRSTYGGRRNSGKVAILEQGLKFEQISVSQRDAQFVEAMQLTIADVARLFRVPMSRLDANPQGGSLTYRTVEADDLYFVLHSLRPWCVRIEEALRTDVDLFPDPEALYPEFLLDALLRGGTKVRYDAHAVATGGKAWMRPSEVRELENLPVDDTIDDEPAPEVPPGSADRPADDDEGADDAD